MSRSRSPKAFTKAFTQPFFGKAFTKHSRRSRHFRLCRSGVHGGVHGVHAPSVHVSGPFFKGPDVSPTLGAEASSVDLSADSESRSRPEALGIRSMRSATATCRSGNLIEVSARGGSPRGASVPRRGVPVQAWWLASTLAAAGTLGTETPTTANGRRALGGSSALDRWTAGRASAGAGGRGTRQVTGCRFVGNEVRASTDRRRQERACPISSSLPVAVSPKGVGGQITLGAALLKGATPPGGSRRQRSEIRGSACALARGGT